MSSTTTTDSPSPSDVPSSSITEQPPTPSTTSFVSPSPPPTSSSLSSTSISTSLSMSSTEPEVPPTPSPSPSSSSSTLASSSSDPPPPSSSSSPTMSSTTPPPSSSDPPPPSSSDPPPPSSSDPPPPSSSDPPPPSSTSEPPPPSSSSTSPPPPPPSSSSTSPPPPPPSSSSSWTPPPPPSSSSDPYSASTTFQSSVWVSTTNELGEPTSTAPPIVTQITTSTSGSVVFTITEVIANPNPTLNGGSGRGNRNAFFSNTGAVAGVFVLVGLAAASILLWIFFAVRRRRRTQRLEHDTAVSATLAAAGFHRAPLDDDDDDNDHVGFYRDHPERGHSHERGSSSSYLDPSGRNASGSMGHARRSSSGLAMSLAGVPMSSAAPYSDIEPFVANPPVGEDGFNPYTDYNPPPSAFHKGVYRDRTTSHGAAAAAAAATSSAAGGERRAGAYEMGSLRSNGGGVQEPLLAHYNTVKGEPTPPSAGGSTPHLPLNTQQQQPPSTSGHGVQPPPYTEHPSVGHAPLPVPTTTTRGSTSARSSVYSAASGNPDLLDKGVALATADPEPTVFADYFFGGGGSSNGHADLHASAASSSTSPLGTGKTPLVQTPASTVPPFTPGGLSAMVGTPRDGILDPRFDGDGVELRDEEDYSRRMLSLSPPALASSSTTTSEKKGGGGGGAKVLGVRNPDAADLGRESWTPRAF